MTNRPHRATINAMRCIALILLAACSGDDTTVMADAAPAVNPHELVACDTASWREAYAAFPDGQQCERACQAPVPHEGPQCATACGLVVACPSTQDVGGVDGCCVYSGPPGMPTFCECE